MEEKKVRSKLHPTLIGMVQEETSSEYLIRNRWTPKHLWEEVKPICLNLKQRALDRQYVVVVDGYSLSFKVTHDEERLLQAGELKVYYDPQHMYKKGWVLVNAQQLRMLRDPDEDYSCEESYGENVYTLAEWLEWTRIIELEAPHGKERSFTVQKVSRRLKKEKSHG